MTLITIIIDWKTILIEFLVIFMILLAASLLLLNKIRKAYISNNHSYILKYEKFLNYIGKNGAKYDCMFILAKTYLEVENNEKFYEYINKVSGERLYLSKLLLFVIHYAINNDKNNTIKYIKLIKNEKGSKQNSILIKSELIYKIRFENYACSMDDIEILKKLKIDVLNKYILMENL